MNTFSLVVNAGASGGLSAVASAMLTLPMFCDDPVTPADPVRRIIRLTVEPSKAEK
ncbi:MAG TPA: hypothetical protein PK286_00070 [Devosia sp.]|nr:hypothetical protein [Devosia sp.]